mmetsp:Transcript_25499/g.35752  ORF Transcript_25499/g.35752 Transcript_25499/m.35752 type:complete len:323 (-) Transcript_25499:1607-2575(-)
MTQTTEKFSVDQDIQYRQKAIMLTRAQSRVKQIEFELAVMKEVADARSEQVKELEKVLKQKDVDLEETKRQNLETTSSVALDRTLGSTGLQSLLAMSQKKLREQEQQSEWNFDQVLELKNQLDETQVKLQDLQQERKIHVAKIEECIYLLQVHTKEKPNGAEQHELHLRALRAVEFEKKMEAYKGLLTSSQEEVDKLEQQREINQAMVKELTKILSSELDATSVDDIIGSLKKGRELEPEQAQLLTIQHLKSQVETLEDEKTRFLDTIASLNKKIMDADEASTCGSPSPETPRKLTNFLRNMRKSPSPEQQHPIKLENHKVF